jgi:hypothetical protein
MPRGVGRDLSWSIFSRSIGVRSSQERAIWWLDRSTLPPVVAVLGKTELPAGELRMSCNRSRIAWRAR